MPVTSAEPVALGVMRVVAGEQAVVASMLDPLGIEVAVGDGDAAAVVDAGRAGAARGDHPGLAERWSLATTSGASMVTRMPSSDS